MPNSRDPALIANKALYTCDDHFQHTRDALTSSYSERRIDEWWYCNFLPVTSEYRGQLRKKVKTIVKAQCYRVDGDAMVGWKDKFNKAIT